MGKAGLSSSIGFHASDVLTYFDSYRIWKWLIRACSPTLWSQYIVRLDKVRARTIVPRQEWRTSAFVESSKPGTENFCLEAVQENVDSSGCLKQDTCP